MNIAFFENYVENLPDDGEPIEITGFMQSRYPLLHCNHSLENIDSDNYGYAFGVTKDQIPFEAELWYGHDPESTNVTFYLPEIAEFDEVEDEPLINATTGTRTFSTEVQRKYGMALCVGMVEDGIIDSLSLLNTYIELLLDSELIAFSSNMLNGAAWRYIDLDGNDIVAVNVTLLENDDLMALTPLDWIKFIPERINKKPLFRVVK
ncbi:MAG: hypothetical protein K5989_11290 [Lachnospiraceae bacterium]|nr:hypothetical protein [Lachnospiraceae bacterium]